MTPSHMLRFSSLINILAGTDVKLRRLVNYWAITAALYVLCIVLLWFGVWIGTVQPGQATWLSYSVLSGSLVFYGLIRASPLLKLTPAQLAFGQALQAIICIIAAYTMAGPVRGAVLTLLLVVLAFCAFALSPRRSHQLSAISITLLGMTIVWLSNKDPLQYEPQFEVIHFVLASSMMSAVVFLTNRFNMLRSRLKAQKAALEQQKNDLGDALERIEQVARRDELTLLPNRRYMKEVLFNEEKRHALEAKTLCLALLDIDHFKYINDTYGHMIGDEVLYKFAQQVHKRLRNADVLARWGGEEFLLLMPNTGQDAAMLVLQRVQKSLRETPLEGNHGTLRVTFSAGLTVLLPGETIGDALRRADKAMYWAKAAGRNTSRCYDPKMEEAITAHEELKASLLYAIQANQFVLHYQPQVTADGKVAGVEALVRWQHPQKGMIFPNDFIHVAEESYIIIDLGQWVLATACEQLASWAKHKETADLVLSVNVSAKQLHHPNFVQHTLAVLERTGINPGKLKMELTESMLIDNVEEVIARMNTLKAAGIRFSLDDFGTGYSSLSYLKRLPLDQVKIDRSFVQDIHSIKDEGVIARAVINLAHGLGFNVIAEGVETESQRDFLVRWGCNDFQGYFFGRPVPVEIFESAILSKTPPCTETLSHQPSVIL